MLQSIYINKDIKNSKNEARTCKKTCTHNTRAREGCNVTPEAATERQVEAALVAAAKSAGGLALKFSSNAAAGYPDRIVILPGKPAFWVELKATGKTPRALQRIRIKELRELGQSVEVVDTIEAAYGIIDAHL